MALRTYTGKTTLSLPVLAGILLLLFPSLIFLVTPYPYISLIFALGLCILLIPKQTKSFLFYVIIFFIPFYKFRILSQRYEFLKVDYIIAFFLVLFILIDIILKKRFPVALRAPVWKYLFMFLLINIVSALLSPYREYAISGLNTVLIAYIFIALNLISVEKEDLNIKLPFIITSAISISAGIGLIAYLFKIQGLLEGVEQGLRAEGVTSGANNMAYMTLFAIPLITHLIFEGEKKIVRIAGVLMLMLCLGGLITSFSRGGFLFSIIITTATLFHHRKKITIRNFGLFVAMAGIVLMGLLSAVPGEYIQRQLTLKKGTQADISTQRRAAYQSAGFKSFLKHPILGTGPFTFRQVWLDSEEIKRFKFVPRPAHNTYMDILVGTGILGLLTFLIVIYKCFRDYTVAIRSLMISGNEKLASLIGSYRISYFSSFAYLIIMSAFEHKLFLLGVSLSQICLRIAQGTVQEHEANV